MLALLQAGGRPDAADVSDAISELTALAVVSLAIGIPGTFRDRALSRAAMACSLVATGGALAVLAAGITGPDAMAYAGWVIVILGIAGTYLSMAPEVAREPRATRRRDTWLIVTLVLAGLTTFLASWLVPGSADVITCGVLWLVALFSTRLFFVSDFRPLEEVGLDVGLVLATLAAAALVGALVLLGSLWAPIPAPGSSAAFSALVTLAMATPAAWWLRRSILVRRYGNGTISSSDVELITADLHAQTQPRDLLDKAARIVATASGNPEARIVLGEDSPAVSTGWVLHPLVVGGDQVGALLVSSGNDEGPELRQQRVVAQLLPTVALVARAVGLAVEAEHARQDVARERDAERTRILGDLHDGLGPVLAGMSMRVQATLRTSTSPEYAELLGDLAADLARSRTDLRRLVAGITPSVLDEGDLDTALQRLVRSFGSVDGGPRVRLELHLPGVLPQAVEVAVYRTVAEGIANALRHAHARSIDVCARREGEAVVVDVVDDGTGGAVVPGVGLSSLERRAAGSEEVWLSEPAAPGAPGCTSSCRHGREPGDDRGAGRRRPPGRTHRPEGADRLRPPAERRGHRTFGQQCP